MKEHKNWAVDQWMEIVSNESTFQVISSHLSKVAIQVTVAATGQFTAAAVKYSIVIPS